MELAELGFTKEELQERVVERCVAQVMDGVAYDDLGEPYAGPSSIFRKMREEVTKQIGEAVSQMAAEKVLPVIVDRIDSLILQETSRWGEQKGEPVSFVEYLIQRAEAYMQEDVNYEGKSRAEVGSYGSFTAVGKRLAVAVNSRLRFEIETAMKAVIADGNAQLTKALTETCKLKMAEIANSLKVQVATK